MKRWFSLPGAFRADLQSGAFTGWGLCNDAGGGYCLAETDGKTLYATILKDIPYIVFENRPVPTVDQAFDTVKIVEEAAAKK